METVIVLVLAVAAFYTTVKATAAAVDLISDGYRQEGLVGLCIACAIPAIAYALCVILG